MGCAASRHGAVSSPGYEVSSSSYRASGGSLSASASASIWSRPVRLESFDGLSAAAGKDEEEDDPRWRQRRPGDDETTQPPPPPARRRVAGEQAAAGWPSWLSAVAAEAVEGWVPLRAEGFEKLEKVGQGTYSSVFRARELATGRAVALKKVRFDSVEPESVRFMAREILVLRRLQRHPNVVGLQGIITSRSSAAVYLVFEYMEHDLAGLTSSSDVTFTEPQIKCYMRQLLEGLAHCHARGVMHRDIKCANLLVSNAGELKVADFGLANTFSPSSSSTPAPPLTSRVVTLWYRPPELLLGATAYEPTVDLWSAGCGRTEVEQIHKVFKLCGSPPEEFWRRPASRTPPCSGRSTRRRSAPRPPDDADHALRLLETLLALDPAARGTAAAALDSDYFRTAPFACDPASLPKYAPNKEMDAKFREDSRRRSNGRGHGGGENAAKRLTRTTSCGTGTARPRPRRGVAVRRRDDDLAAAARRRDGGDPARLLVDLQPVPAIVSKRHDLGGGVGGDGHHQLTAPPCAGPMFRSFKEASPARPAPLSHGPVQLAASTGFAWAKKPRPDAMAAAAAVTKRSSSSKGARANSNGEADAASATAAPYEVDKQEMIKQWAQVADAFSSSEAPNNRRFRQTLDVKQLKTGKKYKGKVDRVDFSGPLLLQPRRIDELLENHEHQIRRAGRRSWFRKASKREQH
ncbi:hypothetical protein EJB05_00850, partial [Eragrostis curvula]